MRDAKGMKLVIVESPAKAKTIEKYLGDGYVVRASVGHVRDLPKSNKKAVDIDGGFVPHYEIVKGKERHIEEIKLLAAEADEVILATDPDREGEAIAWHIKEVAGLRNPKRIVFHEITKEAVAEALAHPRRIDEDLRRAQEARRVLDRLVGYDLSGLIWKKVRYGLSAGRVQSPALRIVMEREREIRAFSPVTYFVITARTKTKRGDPLTLVCSEEPRERAEAERIIAAARREPWRIVSVAESEVRRAPRAPFTTSTLQQAASSRLNLSPAQTMRLAQKLYEAGHITYMRTDSTMIASSATREILTLLAPLHDLAYAAAREWKTKAKTAQEAHEAIRPTRAAADSAGGSEAERKLYALIRSRALASQMADAVMVRSKIAARPGEAPEFTAAGSRVLFDGWLAADPAARGEDVELPKAAEGEPLELVAAEAEEKQTSPPPRYTEAGLVKELEKRGIGRPSTYATIMKTIIDRGYVVKDGRTRIPTDTG